MPEVMLLLSFRWTCCSDVSEFDLKEKKKIRWIHSLAPKQHSDPELPANDTVHVSSPPLGQSAFGPNEKENNKIQKQARSCLQLQMWTASTGLEKENSTSVWSGLRWVVLVKEKSHEQQEPKLYWQIGIGTRSLMLFTSPVRGFN